MKVKISQAIEMVALYLRAGLVPLLKGSPACGKSQAIYAVAKKFNLKVIDLRLAQCDPTDLLGMPTIVGNKADYLPMAHFPVEGDPIPEGYSGWLLFLDELTSARPAIQAAAYKIILDRMVGTQRLHRNVAIAAAGNLETDNAIVEPMSTALQSRLVHLELIVDLHDWLDWAAENQIDHRIGDYLKFKPQNIYTFNPDHTDNTYASPRTWEFAHRVLMVTEESSPLIKPLLAGAIGEGIAIEFVNHLKIYKDIPKMPQIVASPETVPVPQDISILWALTGSISHHATEENFRKLMTYIQRMPREYQAVTMRESLRRKNELKKHPSTLEWVSKMAVDVF